MLGTKIHAPFHRHGKLGLLGLLDQDIDGLRVREALEGLCQQVLQARDETLLHLPIEELQVCPVVSHGVLHAVLQVVLCAIHIVHDVRERELWFDHPEFGQVSGSVRVLCTEGRTKRVDVGQRAAVVLDTQLTADSQVRGFGEEVLAVVDLLVCGHWEALLLRVCEESSDLEHLASTLTVSCCDEWCVHVDKVPRAEEFVGRMSKCVAHSCNGADDGGAWPQVTNRTEELHAVLSLGHWVVLRIHTAEEGHFMVGLLQQQLHRLLWGRALHQGTKAGDGGSSATFALEALVAWDSRVQDDLQPLRTGTIGQLQEHDLLLVSHRSHPAADANGAPDQCLSCLNDLLDLHSTTNSTAIFAGQAGIIQSRGISSWCCPAAEGTAPSAGAHLAACCCIGGAGCASVQPTLHVGWKGQGQLGQRAAQGGIGHAESLPN
mmetsp:Transcript_90905/g.190073  ORF Transcript_90905/g.190073 Transcript_90905/m.190073 type:complete len:433 (-) Transcript_90905:435-1733(-)